MRLTYEQLSKVFQEFLDTIVIPRSPKISPLFKESFAGWILCKRLRTCLKNPKWSYMYMNGKVDCSELMRISAPYLNKGVYLVGMEYLLTKEDFKRLISIHNKIFS